MEHLLLATLARQKARTSRTLPLQNLINPQSRTAVRSLPSYRALTARSDRAFGFEPVRPLQRPARPHSASADARSSVAVGGPQGTSLPPLQPDASEPPTGRAFRRNPKPSYLLELVLRDLVQHVDQMPSRPSRSHWRRCHRVYLGPGSAVRLGRLAQTDGDRSRLGLLEDLPLGVVGARPVCPQTVPRDYVCPYTCPCKEAWTGGASKHKSRRVSPYLSPGVAGRWRAVT